MTDANTDAQGVGAEAQNEASKAAQRAADEARDVAREATERAREEFYNQGDRAKAGVASEISGIADALRKAAGDMRSGSPQERTIGQLAGTLADASDAIRDRDLGEIASELSGFARRNPVAFLGGAALAGFAATRFAKASTSASRGVGSGSSDTGSGASGTATDYSATSTTGSTGAASGQTGGMSGGRTPGTPAAPTPSPAPSPAGGGIPGPATRPATTTTGTGSVSAPASTTTPYSTGER